MAKTVGVVVFPGTNCEMDAVFAVERMGGEGRLLWHADELGRAPCRERV